MKIIGRWESKTGKHWVELYADCTYKSADAGGCLGNISQHAAIAAMQAKVDNGYFLPDSAKTPMRRTL